MKRRKDWLKELAFYVGWGTEFAGSILIGTFLGYFLDKRFGTSPWLTLLGFLFGAFSAYATLWHWVKKER